MKLVYTTALFFIFVVSAHAQQITRDIPYTQLAGGETADLYQPAGAGPFPAIVYIHGGSWRSGNKGVYKKLATDLAAHGYAGFAIDYDLKPGSFPTSWQQSRDAVLYLRTHAADYHLDPDRIVVAGDSAGGELAALVALAPQGPADASNTPNVPVAAALILNGVFRLCANYHVITRYLGDTTLCTDASPMQHIHPNAPPFFIGHGTADATVPYSESQGFTDALRTQHVFVVNYNAKGGHHSYWKQSRFYAPNLAGIEYFLKAKLPPPTPK